MTCPGNHEFEFTNEQQPLFLAYEKRYHMPGVGPVTGTDPSGVQWAENDDSLGTRSCTPSKAVTEYEGGNAW